MNQMIKNRSYVVGELFGYKISAKIYDEPSPYGIENGRISKLTIQDHRGFEIVSYDRGWDNCPTKDNEFIYDLIIEQLEKYPHNYDITGLDMLRFAKFLIEERTQQRIVATETTVTCTVDENMHVGISMDVNMNPLETYDIVFKGIIQNSLSDGSSHELKRLADECKNVEEILNIFEKMCTSVSQDEMETFIHEITQEQKIDHQQEMI